METRLTRTGFRRGVVAFAPAVLLIVFAILLLMEFRQTRIARDHVGRSREAALAAERVFSDLKDAESGSRGYLLIGDDAYLAPYHSALQRLQADTAALRSLLTTDAVQLQRLDSLATVISARLALLARGVELRRAGRADAASDIVRGGVGMMHMREIRAVVTALIAHERRHAETSIANEERAVQALIASVLAGVTLLLLFGYVVNRVLLRFAAARAAATERIRNQHELLQEQSAELELQRDQLQDHNAELELQQDQLHRQAIELEMQQEDLQARAAELEEVNARLQQSNTQLDTARREAEQANRAKSQFLAAMSHELRTPLNAIAGYVDLMEAGIYGELTNGQRDAMVRVKSNQQHLLAVITDILSYSGIAAGTLRVMPQPVHVAPLIAEIEQMMHPVARAQALTLVIEQPPAAASAVAHADPARVRQILINLLANAVKFTPSGGTITLAYRRNDDLVEIDVRDTGVGIASNQQAAIFEPFVQLDRASHDHGGRGGIGLGLALSRELARGMNGEIAVHSAVGIGSVFTLRLPAAAPMALSDAAITQR